MDRVYAPEEDEQRRQREARVKISYVHLPPRACSSMAGRWIVPDIVLSVQPSGLIGEGLILNFQIYVVDTACAVSVWCVSSLHLPFLPSSPIPPSPPHSSPLPLPPPQAHPLTYTRSGGNETAAWPP
ncbi:hypothetical protein PTI98_009160 [Pleurotus ostreatus]|nr:hypothetical protein PTI98_009160 [Pleurotus ostreatus]